MAGRIVLFGATGYTGRLAADAFVERGARPVLAARDPQKLSKMAADLGGLEIQTADVSRPETARALVEEGDVLVSTVGPFTQFGDAALDAAIEAKAAAYIDSTGESGFIRDLWEHAGPRAAASGTGLLTACGYDYVPGNLAAALALREAGEDATRVEVGYFTVGPLSRDAMSGGTGASALASFMEPSFGFHGGRIVDEPRARHIAQFDVGGKQRPAISLGGTEQLSLPRVHPGLEDVDVFLGWFGPASRVVQGVSLAGSAVMKLPGASSAVRGATRRFVRSSGQGPDATARAKLGSHVVARACDGGGRVLAEAHVEGVNGYTFTGRILAWAAIHALEPGLQGKGALGPVEAFGVDALEAGCAECGLEARVLQRSTG
ncbi:MAG: saccharopine dehydrogenase family protein [Thermoleophilaceae bacterium]